MKTKYTNLFIPIRIGNVTFKNRIFSAPRSLQELSPEYMAEFFGRFIPPFFKELVGE